jgi:hypothetical protein
LPKTCGSSYNNGYIEVAVLPVCNYQNKLNQPPQKGRLKPQNYLVRLRLAITANLETIAAIVRAFDGGLYWKGLVDGNNF